MIEICDVGPRDGLQGLPGFVATEDLLVLLGGPGLAPPIDVERVARIGAELCRELGIGNDSKAGRALATRNGKTGRTV